MATPAPTLESLLTPISDEHPAGEDITLAPEWVTIKEARRRDKLTERQNADWPFIRQVLTQALAGKSKDLRLAVWLTEASVKLDGFRGLSESFQLLRGLLETFWDSGLYPEIEGGDVQFRAIPLAWLGGDNLPMAIRDIPITARRDGNRDYSHREYRESRVIGWEKDTRNALGDPDEVKEARRRSALAAGGISAEMFEEAIKSTSRAQMETKRLEFDAAWEEFQKLDRVLDEKFQNDAPGTSEAKEAFDDCRRLFDDLLKRKRQEEPDVAVPVQHGGASSEQTGGDRQFVFGGLEFGGADGGSWAKAEQLLRDGKFQECVAEMTRLASQQYGRANFLQRLRLAEICLHQDRKRLGIAILEELAKTIDELHLDKWESPELLGRVWGRLYQAYRDGEPSSDQTVRGNTFFDRLCKLDPWQAFRWER